MFFKRQMRCTCWIFNIFWFKSLLLNIQVLRGPQLALHLRLSPHLSPCSPMTSIYSGQTAHSRSGKPRLCERGRAASHATAAQPATGTAPVPLGSFVVHMLKETTQKQHQAPLLRKTSRPPSPWNPPSKILLEIHLHELLTIMDEHITLALARKIT